MIANDFLARLKGVEKSSEGWTAQCPGHEDDRASLSVGKGDDGRILLKCFAGCSFETIVLALGLKPADLMGSNGSSREREKIDLEALAKDKSLPVEFLKSLGCRDIQNGVAIP